MGYKHARASEGGIILWRVQETTADGVGLDVCRNAGFGQVAYSGARTDGLLPMITMCSYD